MGKFDAQPGVGRTAEVAANGNARRTFYQGVRIWPGGHEYVSAAAALFRGGHRLVAVAGDAEEALAKNRVWEKRGITAEEHRQIVTGERNEEARDYYELLWQVGGSQSDMAALTAENIDWENRAISYARMKTGSMAVVRFNDKLAAILRRRGKEGYLFPTLAKLNQSVRGTRFSRRLGKLKISGVTLHSYRYVWAERAKTCGFPERFAQEALGHASKAVHRAYAKKAKVLIPPLEDYERKFQAVELPPTSATTLPLCA